MRRGLFAIALVGAVISAAANALAAEAGWPFYGGDEGGQRYSVANQITPANVGKLTIAWTYSTNDLVTKAAAIGRASFENTPILADGRLHMCSPFNEVAALDPGTGKEIWRFDPKIDAARRYPNDFICRGVAYWPVPGASGSSLCATRIFMGTNDRRLIALDARTGKLCASFGKNGTVTIDPGMELVYFGEFQITSAPVVTHGVVIIGSSIDDNQRVNAPRGTVRAFDAMTGAPKWTLDPIAGEKNSGAANVWGPMSVDETRGLVFMPTSSPSPDFFGGLRKGDDRNANSVLAVRAETGEIVWAFQTTHHDVWDYDVAAQPTLATIPYKGKSSTAVLQPTKQGLLFTLDRDSGNPIIPVEERKVPQGGELGEALSPTQPFPLAPKPLAASRIRPDDAWGLTPWDRGACRKLIASSRAEGLYTPPSTKGTILYPFTGGGTNWGGLAFDPARGIAYVNVSNMMHHVMLVPRKDFAAVRAANPDKEVSRQTGAAFASKREIMISPLQLPCNPPPWGLLHAIDMHDGHVLWTTPLGTTEDLMPYSQYVLGKTGVPNIGGPIVTSGGIVFIAAAMDNYLRAFEAKTGKELWRGRLPAGGQATPMTYVWKGRQYVIIAAGGHSKLDTKRGDRLVAFALPR